MRKVFVKECNDFWRHPLVADALDHPELEFVWARTQPDWCSVALFHSIPEPVRIPSVFHLEECRSTWWCRGAKTCCLSEMPEESILSSIRRDLLGFRKIVTHLPKAVPVIRAMYGDEVGDRVSLHRLGIREYEPGVKPKRVRFFFSNSWHNDLTNFYRRGGVEVVEAFRKVTELVDCELTMAVPRVMLPPIHGATVYSERLDDRSMDALMEEAHVFLLPAIDLHSHSVLRARAHGMIPVVCPMPGIEEYVKDGETGIFAAGRSPDWWYDNRTGQWLSTRNPVFRQGLCDHLVEIMTRLAADPQKTAAWGQAIREKTRRDYPLQGWRNSICGELLRL